RGIEGLIHISEFSWSKKYNHPSERFSVGDTVEAMILKVDKASQKLSLGIKQLEEDPWSGVEERYNAGDKIKGVVNAITDYGAFIELEKGVEGLVHVSDLSWTKRITHPREVLKKDEEVEAMILSVDEQNKRIALGIKQLIPDPWDEISKKYEVGTICEGTITNITNFGIFVEIEKDLEGLLHVSEIGLEPSKKIEEIYKVEDRVKVKVIHIDGIQKKIALTMKGLEGEQQIPSQETENDPPEQASPEM
ncbi:MAG: S1 RNA-binding domain-containing protein, partial [Candidatus Omnitrophota bacterium]